MKYALVFYVLMAWRTIAPEGQPVQPSRMVFLYWHESEDRVVRIFVLETAGTYHAVSALSVPGKSEERDADVSASAYSRLITGLKTMEGIKPLPSGGKSPARKEKGTHYITLVDPGIESQRSSTDPAAENREKPPAELRFVVYEVPDKDAPKAFRQWVKELRAAVSASE